MPRPRPVRRRFPLVVAALGALVLLTGSGGPRAAAQGAAPPKLVVILVVDQMRVDYLQWYAANYSAGLARLIRDGAWFTEGARRLMDAC